MSITDISAACMSSGDSLLCGIFLRCATFRVYRTPSLFWMATSLLVRLTISCISLDQTYNPVCSCVDSFAPLLHLRPSNQMMLHFLLLLLYFSFQIVSLSRYSSNIDVVLPILGHLSFIFLPNISSAKYLPVVEWGVCDTSVYIHTIQSLFSRIGSYA